MCEPSIASFQLHTAGESAYRDHAEDAAKVPAQRKYRPREAFRDERLLLTARKRGSALQPRPARRDCGPCPAAPRARSRRQETARRTEERAIPVHREAERQSACAEGWGAYTPAALRTRSAGRAATRAKRGCAPDMRLRRPPRPHRHQASAHARTPRASRPSRPRHARSDEHAVVAYTAPILSRRISPQTAPNCADSRNGTPSSRAHHEAERLAIHAAIILGRDAAAGGGEGEAGCGAAGGRAEDEMGKDERGRGLALDTDDGAGMESDMEGGPGVGCTPSGNDRRHFRRNAFPLVSLKVAVNCKRCYKSMWNASYVDNEASIKDHIAVVEMLRLRIRTEIFYSTEWTVRTMKSTGGFDWLQSRMQAQERYSVGIAAIVAEERKSGDEEYGGQSTGHEECQLFGFSRKTGTIAKRRNGPRIALPSTGHPLNTVGSGQLLSRTYEENVLVPLATPWRSVSDLNPETADSTPLAAIINQFRIHDKDHGSASLMAKNTTNYS
ncbi:hypothetical protein C8J57DRAFT_1674935 [Mycena rebaudengoi]|nr:hypothetical protein C8J57DRAFT_1674935 [Mycena rebaudengoi]